MLAKMDIQQAYCNILVHPNDRHLLGKRRDCSLYIDTTLPIGLRSAPLIFSQWRDAFQWVIERDGVSWLAHYIDDLVTVGAPGSAECARNAATTHDVFEV